MHMESADGPASTAPAFPFRLGPRGVYVAVVAVTIVCFGADLVLPRGATPAIGYSLVPLLAIRTRRRAFILLTMGFCTVLTWVGYELEPAGAPAWMSVFERGMVTGVLWLALAICWQRMRTLTSLEQVSRDLARTNADLDVFASVVAHDLRGPLSAISLFAGLLTRQGAGRLDAQCAESLSSIRAEVDHMSSLIENLLACGRGGDGRFRAACCDCERVLASVLGDLSARLRDTGAVVTHDALPVISADPIQMAQLLQNLIENGVKFHGDQPPHVHIAARRDGDKWVFSVRDNGIGVNPTDADRIFGWFERGGGTTASRTQGTGIGLATCKRIVERHGGRIWVEPAPGVGASFCFTLPRAREIVRTGLDNPA